MKFKVRRCYHNCARISIAKFRHKLGIFVALSLSLLLFSVTNKLDINLSRPNRQGKMVMIVVRNLSFTNSTVAFDQCYFY